MESATTFAMAAAAVLAAVCPVVGLMVVIGGAIILVLVIDKSKFNRLRLSWAKFFLECGTEKDDKQEEARSDEK